MFDLEHLLKFVILVGFFVCRLLSARKIAFVSTTAGDTGSNDGSDSLQCLYTMTARFRTIRCQVVRLHFKFRSSFAIKL